jgi:hypothetical protein
MIIKIVYGILYSIGAIICFSIWKKHQDRDWLLFGCLSIVGCILEVVNYCVNILQVSPNIIVLSDDAILIFAPIEMLLLAWIGFKLVSGSKHI